MTLVPLFRKLLVLLSQLRGFGVAFVDDDAVLEGGGFAGGHFEVAGVFGDLLIVVAEAEGVGGEQAVLADVPLLGVEGVLGGVEDGNAVSFAVDLAGDVRPVGGFAPDVFLARCAGGVGDDDRVLVLGDLVVDADGDQAG